MFHLPAYRRMPACVTLVAVRRNDSRLGQWAAGFLLLLTACGSDGSEGDQVEALRQEVAELEAQIAEVSTTTSTLPPRTTTTVAPTTTLPPVTIPTTATFAVPQLVLFDPASLRSLLNAAGQELMGRNVPDDRVAMFVEEIHASQRTNSEDAKRTGVLYTIDPAARAYDFVRRNYAVEVDARRFADGAEVLSCMLRGDTDCDD